MAMGSSSAGTRDGEPLSNNAIAAGLSSFGEPGLTHHQGFDVARARA
jgi:hypothetical protein